MKKGIHLVKLITRTLLLIWHYARITTIAIAVLSMLKGCVPPLLVLLSKEIIDELAVTIAIGSLTNKLLILLSAAFFIAIASTIIDSLTGFFSDNAAESISLRIDESIIDKIAVLSMSDFDNAEIYNDLTFVSTQPAEKILALVQLICSCLSSATSLFATAKILLSFSPAVFFLCILLSIPSFFISNHLYDMQYKAEVQEVEWNRIDNTLHSTITQYSNLPEIKLFNMIPHIKELIVHNKLHLFKHKHEVRLKSCVATSLQSVIYNTISIAIKLLLVSQAIRISSISIGYISMLVSATENLQTCVESILRQLTALSFHLRFVNALFHVMDAEDHETSLCDKRLPDGIHSICFSHVTFTYPERTIPALNDVSFCIKKNVPCTLVGINGSGKSTILKLIMKLYLPTSGRIYINGIDIKELNTANIRSNISSVFQDFVKLPMSVAQNIAASDFSKECDTSRIIRSSDISLSTEDILELPHAFDTKLKKGFCDGTELSQGQWQKLAIARCAFRNASVYIFDEPFSAIDSATKKQLEIKLADLSHDKICIHVTHDLSRIPPNNIVLLFRNGKLIGNGTHTSLIAANIYYAELNRN